MIAAEPALAVVLSGAQVDEALLAVGNFVDLKSPYMFGHAHAVADLAAHAAVQMGLGEAAQTIRRAGLVHDLGRLGVSNAIWDKRGPLGPGEWERVRLLPYLTGRMLKQSEALAPLGAIVVQHHERLDGSGYPQGHLRLCDLAPGADSRRRRRLPGDARAAAPPACAHGRRSSGRATGRRRGRTSRCRRSRVRPRRSRSSRAAPS